MTASFTPYHSQLWAYALTLQGNGGDLGVLSQSISAARVDLNPHQVDAALFALRSPLAKGAILADEVGLGKTIEAGLVIAQFWAARRRRVLLIVPATLRKQWQAELWDKFALRSEILEAASFRKLRKAGAINPFEQDAIVICSYQFAAQKRDEIARAAFHLAVIDEAHRLRNVFRRDSKIARAIREGLADARKLLLTATPLQNNLLELYGLVSVIDDQVFGDEYSFREQFVKGGDEARRNVLLRERLKPLLTRTLRKQVSEYISFTRRIALTQDFTPGADEQRLYDSVTAYLQRADLIALPKSQRTLLTLILRKLLASSSHAIAGTLDGLIARLSRLKTCDGDALTIVEADYETTTEVAEEWSDEEEDEEPAAPVDQKALDEELLELRGAADLAKTIRENAKARALIEALSRAFAETEKLGAARKAVIFTESVRTQRYLAELLAANGYDGRIVLINGSNADAGSQATLRAWLQRHKGTSIISGSKSADMKAALVEEFRDRGTLLIATESAAEGVNLQFCSLVINFDLPWNPQRIEQRIGRCHRYGQKHDVVVVNFVNRRNAADQRVYQLLSQKFRLFDGVFGSSDEVLGALESGVDIEKRIAAVYQTCRTDAEIETAFDTLQRELEEQIAARMADTRTAVLDHFDAQIAERFKLHRRQAMATLDARARQLFDLLKMELAADAIFDLEFPRFTYRGAASEPGSYCLDWKLADENGDRFLRFTDPLPQHAIATAKGRSLPTASIEFVFDEAELRQSALESWRGKSGILEVTLLTTRALDETSEFLLTVGRSDGGAVLDQDLLAKLFALPARLTSEPAGIDGEALQSLRDDAQRSRLAELEARNAAHFEAEVRKLDLWAEDLKEGLEREIKALDAEIREAKKTATAAASLQEKLEAQKHVRTLEARRKEKRKRLYDEQDAIDEKRDALIADIERRLAGATQVKRLFALRWRLT